MTDWTDIPGNPETFDSLVASLCDQPMIAFVGAGASAGLCPTWDELIDTLGNLARGYGADSDELTHVLAQGDPQASVREIRRAVPDGTYLETLGSLFGDRITADGHRFTLVHEQLVHLPFAGFVTTNYDGGLHEARRICRRDLPLASLVTPRNETALRHWLTGDVLKRDCPILSAHGIASDPSTIVLDSDDYRQAYVDDSLYRRVFFRLWTQERLVFVGFGFQDPWFRYLAEHDITRVLARELSAPRHVALVDAPAEALTDAAVRVERRRFEEQYHARTLFLPIPEVRGERDYSVLVRVLARLRDALSSPDSERVGPTHQVLADRYEPLEPEPAPSRTTTLLPALDTVTDANRPFYDELRELIERRDELASQGLDTSALDARVLELKRQMRRGPELPAGYLLADRYLLVRLLGKGGFASVWQALDRERGQPVALKVLHGQHASTPDRIDRLFRGARQMAKLDHPHIVEVLDEPGIEDGWAFFTMELLDGDFRQAVREDRLDRDQRLAVLDQVAAALEHAHSERVVHRDIKPGNILLTADGTAKLSDFDLVKAFDTTGATRTRQGMGSYHYAAPETMLDAAQAGAACDVYGLAVTALFALLGDDPGPLFMGYRDRYFETVDLPVGVREVLHRAMAHDPEERHSSPTEFCQALRAGLTEPEPDPPPPDQDAEMDAPPAIQTDEPSDADDLPTQLERSIKEARYEATLQLIEKSIGTTDLTEIFFLDWALRRLDAEDEASQLYDTLPDPTDPDLFRVATIKDREVALWQTIPAGEGWIGSPADEKGRHAWEGQRRPITVVRPFALAAVPVTNAQWAQLDPKKANLDRPNHPVVEVTWWEAMTFCRWLDYKLGLGGARLPTEEEWEYACRAGTGTRFWSGDSEADLDRAGWYRGNRDGGLQPVGQKEANPFGLFDVHGNVWEWTRSPQEADYSHQKDRLTVNPTDPPADLARPRAGRAVRGGSCWSTAGGARSAYRSWGTPGFRNGDRGFRVLLPSPAQS